ncbi:MULTISPECIES: bifunctional glutamate N-acetyltransferase/amino-acid acetyltransferase ArgJ [Rhodomicrobium]|uniref:bifunctional glutamate N-acetyltransferase/amino-acid acetyltransferase ArgJ n=1 Tax=Rhodomicrobium TaxID=1068 RepID=UPI001FDA1FF5|nr:MULTISPECIES: bifunctional glutamate N-acetyltransferase/amino-acid acetyltransferase ArgJ [Rhodomicrobium]
MTPSPFAPKDTPKLPAITGVRMAAAEAGIRYKNRKDVLLVLLPEGTQAAGVLTRSKTSSAPVDWCRRQLAHGRARALVVNSGNANAFTGLRGWETVETTAALAAVAAGCDASEVFLASTGVIGEPIPPGKFEGVLDRLAGEAVEDGFAEAASAIMTTDTFPKFASRTAEIGGVTVTLNGIAKGSGMIAPDMATMLGFIFTDAAIVAPALQALVSRHVETTFNSITVDSDTSTSDTLLVFATGNGPRIESADDPALAGFSEALRDLMQELAVLIIKDGEGISKLITVTVEGAESDAAAKRIALSIANSPLVKTAVAGEDANWGRVVMAVGKAGEAANRDKLSIWFGDILVAEEGHRSPDYSEAAASAYMKGSEIAIRAAVGTGGSGRATVWGCDLTEGYLRINGSYRS